MNTLGAYLDWPAARGRRIGARIPLHNPTDEWVAGYPVMWLRPYAGVHRFLHEPPQVRLHIGLSDETALDLLAGLRTSRLPTPVILITTRYYLCRPGRGPATPLPVRGIAHLPVLLLVWCAHRRYLRKRAL